MSRVCDIHSHNASASSCCRATVLRRQSFNTVFDRTLVNYRCMVCGLWRLSCHVIVNREYHIDWATAMNTSNLIELDLRRNLCHVWYRDLIIRFFQATKCRGSNDNAVPSTLYSIVVRNPICQFIHHFVFALWPSQDTNIQNCSVDIFHLCYTRCGFLGSLRRFFVFRFCHSFARR